MRLVHPGRMVVRASAVAVAATLATGACVPLSPAAGAIAAPVATTAGGPGGRGTGPVDPYAPSYRHPYRHGAVPTRQAQARMAAYQAQHQAAGPDVAPGLLQYGGGSSGFGVVTGQPKVYLVFWGSAWGTASTNSQGDTTFSGDPYGGAPFLQELFKGLGTNGELWSGVMTQYCEGVPVGSTSCPATAPHVAYPSGGVLAGVFYDGVPISTNATAEQIGTEAVKAAQHFGNTTTASNRNAQYVILSPTGYHPDGFGTAPFCAWHDAMPSSYGPIPFTNLPYTMDRGVQCFVTGPGTSGALTAYSTNAGHEYAETLTDPLPPNSWTDPALGREGENADKCQLVFYGPVPVTLATGTFVLPATWSNEDGQCLYTHAVEPQYTTVPNLVGLTQVGANAALRNAGVVLGQVSKVVDCNDLGIVLHQNPASGTTVLATSAVSITIGSRPAPPRFCP